MPAILQALLSLCLRRKELRDVGQKGHGDGEEKRAVLLWPLHEVAAGQGSEKSKLHINSSMIQMHADLFFERNLVECISAPHQSLYQPGVALARSEPSK